MAGSAFMPERYHFGNFSVTTSKELSIIKNNSIVELNNHFKVLTIIFDCSVMFCISKWQHYLLGFNHKFAAYKTYLIPMITRHCAFQEHYSLK
jgi:hypothetical protein